jgi:hypothetical protein
MEEGLSGFFRKSELEKQEARSQFKGLNHWLFAPWIGLQDCCRIEINHLKSGGNGIHS